MVNLVIMAAAAIGFLYCGHHMNAVPGILFLGILMATHIEETKRWERRWKREETRKADYESIGKQSAGR